MQNEAIWFFQHSKKAQGFNFSRSKKSSFFRKPLLLYFFEYFCRVFMLIKFFVMKKIIYFVLVLCFTNIFSFAQEKYAVLIIGDCTDRGNHVPPTDKWNGGQYEPPQGPNRFWNDTYLMWEMLQAKGFNRENIFVLFNDGVDCHPENPRYRPPTNVTVVNGRADLSNVTNIFEGLRYGTNGMPVVTEDDFLFVWVFDHGGYSNGHSSIYLINGQILYDTDFASLVNPIPAHRKAFWMQQCHSGGFADDLTAHNTVFISATQAEQLGFDADNKTNQNAFQEENEIFNGYPYKHGEFNFHMLSVVNQKSPTHQLSYNEEPYTNGNTDSDSFISMNEAYQWLINHSSRTTAAGLYEHIESEDPVYDDIGSIGNHMSFEYPTLLFDDITNNETHRGIIGVSKDLVISSGQTLTFVGTSNVTLCNSSRIVIEPGASLVISGNVSFYGTDNNLLEIHGELIQNNGSSLSFTNMQVTSYASDFSIAGAHFTNTELKYRPFGSSAIAQSTSLTGNITVRNCQFDNPTKSFAILIENSRDFDINGNTVSRCTNNGICIRNCGNVSSGNNLRRNIRNNEISGCSSAGLVFYASTGNIYMNKIHDNGTGVKLLNRCNILNFSGNCDALSAEQTQHIFDNNSVEIYITSNCYPLNMHYNSINKTNVGNTPFVYFDNIISYYQNERGVIDLSKNEWGVGFNPNIHLHSTTATVGFEYLPYWGFHDCSEWQLPNQRLLAIADSLCNKGDFDEAKTVYHQVIEENPNSVCAESALKALLPLESFTSDNYKSLKQYFLTDSIIVSQESLSNLSLFLANRCDEILANYSEAIAWYEDVITDPETTFTDSIFAVIDLGNLYMEMEENGSKTVGKLAQFKPESRPSFEKQCEEMYSLIPKQLETDLGGEDQYDEPHLPFWSDTIVSQPSGYIVDASGNVEISSSDGLVWLISTVNGLNGCAPDDFEGRIVRLNEDIDFGETGYDYNFSPIGTRETPFSGTFDGNGHKIHNLRLWFSGYDNQSYDFDMGVFGYIRHATVKNVTVDSTCRISSSCSQEDFYRGGFVGFSDSLSVVENCHIRCPRTSYYHGGSLVGMNRNSTVRNCSFGGRNYSAAPLIVGGGLVSHNRSEGGYADAVVENCYFHGWIDTPLSARYIGGLVGFNETEPNSNGKRAVVRNCHITPTYPFEAICYGSLVAVDSEESLIEYCYADLTNMYQYNNMVGTNQGEMSNCHTYANIDGTGTLANPVTLNGITTNKLIDALNLWIAEQDHPELYRTWVMIADSIPVLGDYYVGIHENPITQNKVTVCPNPASDYFVIQGVDAELTQVFNVFGQLVKTVQNTNEISAEGLPDGIYLLRIATIQGKTHSVRVVVGL